MSVPGGRPSFRAMDAWPGIGFAALYLLTLSRTLSVTHDSALFLGPIERFHPTLVPNHLWFEPLMVSAYRLMMLGWPDIGAQRAAEVVNAVSGAAALQAAYMIAVWRIGVTRWQAALAVACAGFTYGVWYYSIAIETYALPLVLTAWIFFGLTSPRLRWPVVIACAGAHSIAILCHQSAVLFGAVALAAMLTCGAAWRTRTAYAAAYLLLGSAFVGGAYTAAAVETGHAQNLRAAVRWSVGYLPRRGFWERPPRGLVLASVGAVRGMVGGQFIFADPAWVIRASRWFPHNDPVDERFFVRSVTPTTARLFLGASILVLVSIGMLMTMAAVTLWARGPREIGRDTGLLAMWLAVYCGFFTLWDPSNPDFWIVQVYLAPLLAMFVLVRAWSARVHTLLFLTLASSLLVVNGLSTVRLARDPANDYYAVYLRSVARELEPEDVLLLGDHWPIGTHIQRLRVNALFMSVEITRTRPDLLAAHVRQLLDGERRVFAAPDVLEPSAVAAASYGPRYVTYLEAFRGHLCGLGKPLGGPDEMHLREVTCVDQRRFSSSSSSSVLGQSLPSNRESPRSASSRPPVWHRAQ